MSATVGTGGTGRALSVNGRASFSTAGLSTIASGSKSVLVDPGCDIVATSKVLATLQTSAGGTSTIHRVVRDAGGDTFTIYLTANATQDCTVAWFVIG